VARGALFRRIARIAPMPAARHSAAMPLLRLLGINCAAGIAVALLGVCGLLALNAELRNLILSDHSPGVALTLLAGGFIVTFASAAVGTAIMRLDQE
jgi:hypothetical protein